MNLPIMVSHFALISGLDITREGSLFKDTPRPCHSWRLSWKWFLFTQPWSHLHTQANTAGFGEVVEDNWGRR